jgi:hypothetical protein
MVAFSCCKYDGGSKENNAMVNARERSWRGKFHRPGRVINPEANRRNGRCPLTPLEVATFVPCNLAFSEFLRCFRAHAIFLRCCCLLVDSYITDRECQVILADHF